MKTRFRIALAISLMTGIAVTNGNASSEAASAEMPCSKQLLDNNWNFHLENDL